ncbi:uncharacterized protein LOC129570938, partial [Sitodiplosis mosellana]|uniref:uncharacterized protein LOC129570938 n=1 Tax=Sitodiplosis mosellana TaxID=263140 RepID=UPI002444A25E
ASSGIGAHAAERLARKGASVALVGRNEQRLNEASERIKSAGSPAALAIVADVTVDAERIINETINHFGKLNVLINNASIYSRNSIENMDLNEYDRIMNTNMRSVIQLTKLAVPHLEKTKVNAINPVAIRTPLFETSVGMTPQQAEAFFESFKNIYPCWTC